VCGEEFAQTDIATCRTGVRRAQLPAFEVQKLGVATHRGNGQSRTRARTADDLFAQPSSSTLHRAHRRRSRTFLNMARSVRRRSSGSLCDPPRADDSRHRDQQFSGCGIVPHQGRIDRPTGDRLSAPCAVELSSNSRRRQHSLAPTNFWFPVARVRLRGVGFLRTRGQHFAHRCCTHKNADSNPSGRTL